MIDYNPGNEDLCHGCGNTVWEEPSEGRQGRAATTPSLTDVVDLVARLHAKTTYGVETMLTRLDYTLGADRVVVARAWTRTPEAQVDFTLNLVGPE